MNIDKDKIGEAELLAYVDGQLDAQAREIVEAYLDTHPDAAERVAQWLNQSEAIEALYGQDADQPVPDRLDPHKLAGTPIRSPLAANANLVRMAAAAMVLLAFGVSLGWFGQERMVARENVPQTLIAAAFSAHNLFVNQPRHFVEVGNKDQAHLTRWLSNALDRRLVVPAILPSGHRLIGGRVLPAAEGNVVQVMYQSDPDQRVTLYLTPKTADEPKQNTYASLGDLDALYWANDNITCTIVGNLAQAEMEQIAASVFKALSWQDENYQRG